MHDIVISLKDNVLKVSAIVTGQFFSVVKDVPAEIAEESKILDALAFGQLLNETIFQLFEGKKAKVRANFILEPSQVEFKFITTNKNSQDQLDKVEGIDLNEYFFSYVKIAPFVYQFVGAKKEVLEKYLEASQSIGLEIRSIVSWPALLPKYVGSNSSSIFICTVGKTPTVILSELGGVFFVGSYDEKADPEELYKHVQDLSVYKRVKPIDKIYTLNYTGLKEIPGFEVHAIELPLQGTEQTAGFETSLLTDYMLNLSPEILDSQVNLLHLLPLPAVAKKQTALVGVGIPVAAVMVGLAIFGGFTFFTKNKNVSNGGQVLSEKIIQSSEAVQATPSGAPTKEVTLERKDLVVRIENGSGVDGIAGATKEVLEAAGYKVISIDTAGETRDDTLFKFKDAKIEFKDMIQSDLKDKLPEPVIEQGIDTANEYDLLIVVGTSQKIR